MNSPRACIFDYGDTLVGYPLHNFEGQINFLTDFFRRNGSKFAIKPERPLVPEDGLPDFVRRLNTERPTGEVWPFSQRIRAEQFLGDRLAEGSEIDLERALCEEVFRQGVTFRESLTTLRQLKRLGYRLAIVSNTPWGTSPTLWREELSRRGFGPELIDCTVFCCDAGYRKPRKEPFEDCLRSLGVFPQNTVFVGDNAIADIQGAAKVGCHPVLFDRGSDKERPNVPGHRVSSLAKLPKLLGVNFFH